MNKTYNTLVIFLLTLYLLMSIFEKSLYLSLGKQTYQLSSFFNWLALKGWADTFSTLAVVVYFYFKNYRSAFLSGMMLCLSLACNYSVIYWMQTIRQLESFYIPAYWLLMGAGTFYGVSLIISKTSERIWLKVSGCLILSVVLLISAGRVAASLSLDFELNIRIEKLMQATSWFSISIPVCLILHFLRESRNRNVNSPSKYSLIFPVGFIALITAGLAIFLGKTLISESSYISNPSPVSELAYAAAQPFKERTFTGRKGSSIRYRLMLPIDYNPAQKYPVVVCLHHGGAHGSDNVKQVDGSEAPWLANFDNRRKYPAFLFVPQCPKGQSWLDPSIALPVFEAMEALEKEFSIDIKRRYILGVSGGGYGSWHFTSAHPDLFAAAIPICGAGNPDFAYKLVNMSIWAFHGENDALAPVGGSRDMIAAIRQSGGRARYTEYKGAGHDITQQVHSTPGLLDWLFSQKRR